MNLPLQSKSPQEPKVPLGTEPALETEKDLIFDDRVDVEPIITSIEALKIMGRSLALLGSVKGLFALKFLMAAVSLLPVLMVPWLGKIIVDQVLLQRPFGETEVRFPPFMEPFIRLVADMSPIDMMGVVVLLSCGLLVLFGTRGPGTDFTVIQGQDSATQSEYALSAGSSSSGGIWGSIEALINVRLTQRIANRLRTRLFEKISRLSMTTLEDQRTGDSVYRVMYDAPQVPNICFNLGLVPFFAIASSLINLYLMQYSYGEVAPVVVWIAYALLPIALVVTIPLSGWMRRVNQHSRAAGSATTNVMEESINSISAVQSLGGMAYEKNRFDARSKESFKRYRFAYALSIFIFILGWAVTIVAGIFVARIVTLQIIAGSMSPGDFWTLFGLYLQLGGVALGVGLFWIQLQANVAAVRRVFFLIDYPTEDPVPGSRLLAPVKRKVVFENVRFAYPDSRWTLTDINLEFSLGELVAIVGPTGAGKTSLAYLLPGFLRPTEGRILFDDQDISEFNVDSLRDQVTYVFQEHMLLSESIRSNFLLVKSDATDAQINSACRTAGAMEFIEQLPNGLDTVLGRSGDTLSVGQQQRLSIARGMIRESPVLILDEPTAALDPQSENELVEALLKAADERLVVVIAHRLSTIRRADRIIFLDEGQVKDIGSHATLMANPESPYRRFVELQAG